ncbi:geranylgeranylglycerol-phosphate geranylgeranyltransferase [Lutibacter sp.]
MNLVAFFKLIRWKNVLLLLYIQVLLKIFVFNSLNTSTNLSTFQFLVLLVSILLITSAGYIINDIFDVKTDLINKPQKVIVTKYFTVEKTQQLYVWLNAIGIALGIGLSLHIEKPTYSFLFIGTSLLLYYYSKIFKSKPLIGNLIVSFLTSFSIYTLYIFEISISKQTHTQLFVFYLTLVLCLFAFLLNLIREIVKDITDLKGDYNLKMSTLPIVIGKGRTKKIALFLCFVTLGLLVVFVFYFASIFKFTILYLIPSVMLPLLYVLLKLKVATSKNDFQKLSVILKVIMFLGINAVIIFSLNY